MKANILTFFITIAIVFSLYKIVYGNKSDVASNRIIKHCVVTVKPNSTFKIKLNKSFWIVPLTDYGSYSNFFGIRIKKDVFLFDNECHSIFQAGSSVEIINTFSENEQKLSV